MRMQQIRRERGLMATTIAEQLKAVDARVDAALVSKMETGLCLPTRAMLAALCEILGVTVAELYKREEIDLPAVGRQVKGEEPEPGKRRRRVEFPLNEQAERLLSPEALARAGYRSKAEWFYDCLRHFEEKIKEDLHDGKGA